MIQKLISGMQSGSDIAGIHAAVRFNIPVSGYMPKNFLTLDGNRPEYKELYNAIEDSSPLYPPRTEKNVINSDATIRFAYNFSSPGEKCTLKFIKAHSKPYLDIDLSIPDENYLSDLVVDFISKYNVKILNVAGNTARTNINTYKKTLSILTKALTRIVKNDQ